MIVECKNCEDEFDDETGDICPTCGHDNSGDSDSNEDDE